MEGEQETDRGNDLEVRGEQATRGQQATAVAGAVPTAIDAGLRAGIALVNAPLSLLVVLAGLLVAAGGYLVRRRRA